MGDKELGLNELTYTKLPNPTSTEVNDKSFKKKKRKKTHQRIKECNKITFT
jgi:hypothetical protein